MNKPKPIEELFGQALEMSSSVEREEFLVRACANDTNLRQEIDALLHAHHQAGTFLSGPEQVVASGTDDVGNTPYIRHPEADGVPAISGFRVDRKIGEGGLGTVYEAWDEKLHRKVALKILRRLSGVETQRAVLEEARKAAALDDPAIVTIHAVLDEQE